MAVTAANKKANTQQITSSITGICDHLMTVVRSMMKQLHPLVLTELGLKATLEDMIQQWELRDTTLSFNLQYDEAVDSIDKIKVIQIYRVIQEGLTNVIRHANASHVTISLMIKSDVNTLSLLISDDGQGCNLKGVASGFGLLGMEERVKLLGGQFTIKSKTNQGTQIIANIPL